MAFKQTIQSHDFSATPAVFKIFDIPADHTIVRIFSTGITFATGLIALRTGTGGSIDSGASDYRLQQGRDTTWVAAADAPYIALPVNSGVNSLPFQFDFYNFNTLSPIVCWGFGADDFVAGDPPLHCSGMRQSASSFDQLEIRNANGTNITGGTVYVVSYERTVTVTSEAAATDNILTGLKKNKGLVVVSALGITYSAAQAMRIRISTGGTEQSGASDYLSNQTGANFRDAAVLDDRLNNTEVDAATAGGMFSIIAGMMETNIHTTHLQNGDLRGTGINEVWLWMGIKDSNEANNEIYLSAPAAATAGTVYFSEYKV